MTDMTATLEQLLGNHADQIGARIGADPAQTQGAISAALPTLLGALQQQAQPGTGLQQAIERDHDGSILDDLGGYLNGTANLRPQTLNGPGILGHLLGDQQPGVQQALSAQTGLSMGSIGQLLPILAPIVMGMLGKNARSTGAAQGAGGLDLGSILASLGGGAMGGSGSGGVGDILGGLLGGTKGS